MKLSERNRQALEAALPAINEVMSHARSDAFDKFQDAVRENTGTDWEPVLAATRELNSFRELETRIINAAKAAK